jgi:subtilisin family serine protease
MRTNILRNIILLCIVLHTDIIVSIAQKINNNVDKKAPFKFSQNITNKDYLEKTIIFKIKGNYRNICSDNNINDTYLKNIFNDLGIVYLQKKFKNHDIIENNKSNNRNQRVDISLIYELKYSNDISLDIAINKLLYSPILEYAEPHYIYKPLFYPNDPKISEQYSLDIIKAYQAWDITQGDTNVVIGIVDSGVDIDHPDIINSIKYNYNDPIDGIDNDNDGFIDNYRGWNLADNNNIVQVNSSGHGAKVAGVACASTNNGTGIAGIGFKCKILPVKVENSDGIMTMALEGIVYAADHGCQIINCSWGIVGAKCQYGQDIINYATFNKNALVVAAAGNDGDGGIYYPAAYDNVISVGATNNSDIKWSSSNYGYNIDLMAPGVSVETTFDGGSYNYTSGTSFAAALVSGCAALLKSKFPNFNALQIGEQLCVSADKIDTIGYNYLYANQIGNGRVNIFRALSDTSKPSFKMNNINMYDNNDDIFTSNDTVRIAGTFTNYLHASYSASVVMTCSSPYVKILNPMFYLDNVPTLGTTNNILSPFKIIFNQNIPNDEEVVLTLTFNDPNLNYSAKQYVNLLVNPSYLNVYNKNISLSVANNSRIGYVDVINQEGEGLIYKNSKSLLSYGGLLIGNTPTSVEDNLRGSGSDFKNDFIPIGNIKRNYSSLTGKCEVSGMFNDNNVIYNKLNLMIKYNFTTYDTGVSPNFILLKYTLINQGSAVISALYGGLFADFDITNSSSNRIEYDKETNMLYTYSLLGGPYIGLQLIANTTPYYYAFDIDGSNGSIDINDGFSNSEKYTALTSVRPEAGMKSKGNDVASLISTGPYNIASNDSISLNFALITGDYLGEIKSIAKNILKRFYPEDTTINNIIKNNKSNNNITIYPQPSSHIANIDFTLTSNSPVELQVYDFLGNLTDKIYLNPTNAGKQHILLNTSKYQNGVYICKLLKVDKNGENEIIINVAKLFILK